MLDYLNNAAAPVNRCPGGLRIPRLSLEADGAPASDDSMPTALGQDSSSSQAAVVNFEEALVAFVQ